MACHPGTLASGAMSGADFETFVVAEIRKSGWHCGRTPPLFHDRDRDAREVDLLLDVDGVIHPVEIERSATVRRDWTRTIEPLKRLGRPVGECAVVCLTRDTIPIGRDLVALPVGAVWGRSTRAARPDPVARRRAEPLFRERIT